MKLRLHEYNLPLTHPFTISRGTITVQGTLIVELQQDGVSGYGEATVNAYYDAGMADMKNRFTGMEPVLAIHTFRDTDSFWKLCAEHLADAPFVLAALDCAAHDLWGRLENTPVHRLWGLDPNDAVESSFTIGIAINSRQVDEAAYQKEKSRIEAEWNLPATDVFRESAEPLVNAARALLDD